MLKKDFDKFLSIKAKEQKNTSKIDWEREKNEWIEHLENLYHIFEEALEDYIRKGQIEIIYDDIEITEEFIGNYNVRKMTVGFAEEKIVLKPVGTNLIGAKGRVDITGKSGSARIVLVDSRMKGLRDHIKVSIRTETEKDKKNQRKITWEWKFVTAPPTRIYQPVNKDTVYSVIMELSNG